MTHPLPSCTKPRLRKVDPAHHLCSNYCMPKGRILAVDYGTKHVGLACCDELGVIVRPLPSIRNRNNRELMIQLRASVRANDIEAIVVGIPLNMDGTAGKAAARVQRFIGRLRSELNLPLAGVDERLSSVEALELWKDMSPRQQKKYSSMDSLAAALILERYLRER